MAWAQKRERDGQTVWVARWQDPDGRRRSRQPFDRKRDALAYATEQETSAVPPDTAADRRTLTVEGWIGRWLARRVRPRVQAGQLRPRTAEGYESTCRNHIVPDLGHLLLTDLRVGDVETWTTGKLAAGYAGSSARQYRAVLSAALSDAVKAGLLDGNPVHDADVPEGKSTADDPSVFTPAETSAIVEAAREHDRGAVVLVALATGLRASELAGLTWGRVDLDGAMLTVDRTLHRVSGSAASVTETGLLFGPPKNRGSLRTIPLASETVGLLRRHKVRQNERRLAAARWGPDGGHVFTTSTGTPLEPRRINRILEQILDTSGVERDGVPFHELRRTWATTLRDAGVPLEVVMKLGGWSSPDVLLRLYAGRRVETLRDAASVSGRVLGEPQ